MSLGEDLEKEVSTIITSTWDERDGVAVPEPEDIALGNHAVKLEATVLYADLADSTQLVQRHTNQFAAEVFKCFLHCASKIIRSQNGAITAFDGDRVMGVFIGDGKNSAAARAALKINHATTQVITPKIREFYKNDFTVRHAVGVDTGSLTVARTGIRGSNDLVWVGRPANYAAKLSALRQDNYTSWITADVHDRLNDEAKFTNGQSMWTKLTWKEHGITVYASHWRWGI